MATELRACPAEGSRSPGLATRLAVVGAAVAFGLRPDGAASPQSAASAPDRATLAASASYIAAPTAMRIAVPEANAALSITAALGITFPFNIVIGIPLYIAVAQRFVA